MSRTSGWSVAGRDQSEGRRSSADEGRGRPSGGFSTPQPSELSSLTLPMLSTAPLDSSSKHARKIYIGNLPPSATSEMVISQFFNQTLATLLPNKPPGDSVVGTYLNIQKRFAFIENRSIEETTFTLGLDGIQMDDYALKLRRPQDYNPQLAQQQLSQEMRLKSGISSLRGAWNPMQQTGTDPAASGSQPSNAPGIVSTSVEDGPNKVFIGGLPHHMGEYEVKELLASYGALKAFHLVKDRELDRSKGFAFCEWRDPAVTDIACQALNGMKVGDRCLNVRRAVPHSAHRGIQGMFSGAITDGYAGSAAGNPLALAYSALPEAPLSMTRLPPPQQKGLTPLNLPEVAPYLKKESTHGSRCIAVKGILPQMEDTSQVSVEEVQQNVDRVKSLAVKMGRVRNAQFHHSDGGRVLIEFSTPEEASIAQKYLNGREITPDVKAECYLTEMISELRKKCIARIIAEAEMLSRLNSETRQIYIEREQQKVREIRTQREALLREQMAG